MHVRRDRKKNRKGKTYVSLVHNVWEKGESKEARARPVVFARLGPEDQVDPAIAQAMATALESYIEARWLLELSRNPQANRKDVVEQASREFGPHGGGDTDHDEPGVRDARAAGGGIAGAGSGGDAGGV